ncbi:MAG: hypothetical protein WCK35_30040, partial [Chloroflexota bacterium]
MSFTTGQLVILGENKFEIKHSLGSGAISEAYLAVPVDSPENEVVIKMARQGLEVHDQEAQNALEGLRNEARSLRILNLAELPDWKYCFDFRSRLETANLTKTRRKVVVLLDSGENEHQQPYQVQEKAPPAIVAFEIASITDEYRLIKIMDAVLDVLSLSHKNGLALKDFEPNTKWDRIRLSWLDEKKINFEMKIIDWNVTGGPESAPQDLLYFGGHLFRFLYGHNIVFEGRERNQPPLNLSSLTRNWSTVTEGSRQILQKILQRDLKKRYQSVEELQVEFKWWLGVLQEAQLSDGYSEMQNQIWDLKRQEKYSQVMSVADLGMRVFPSEEVKQGFLPWVEQARQELEKRDVLPIARARGTL